MDNDRQKSTMPSNGLVPVFKIIDFLAIFRNEITTILTPSTLEESEWGLEVVTFFVLEVPDYESVMLIYLFIYRVGQKLFDMGQKKLDT